MKAKRITLKDKYILQGKNNKAPVSDEEKEKIIKRADELEKEGMFDYAKKIITPVTAVEQNGFDARYLTVILETKEGVDVLDAIKKASKEYCETPEGKKVLFYNGGCFNLADFEMNVSNDICKKYGIKK